MIVYTLGHSTLEMDAFRQLLVAHRIAGLVDVRRFPASPTTAPPNRPCRAHDP